MPLIVHPTTLRDVKLLEPLAFDDARGFFMESFNARDFAEVVGFAQPFVQDNHSRSRRGVLRGMHYQIGRPQGKLVRVTDGEILDVAVDLRRSSPDYGKWTASRLSCENRLQMWIPPGFAHGFLALSEQADVLYKTTDYWCRECERAICWNDPDLAIAWPDVGPLQLAEKDLRAGLFEFAETFE
ncbi:dTDP-4-dehydrorhamnose 3,5-epimerase [Cupriavidus basilensis]